MFKIFKSPKTQPEKSAPEKPADILKEGDLRRRCVLYFHRSKAEVIIATQFKVPPHEYARYFEHEDAISTCPTDDAAALGKAVKDHFIASRERKEEKRLDKPSKKDWPAFKASRLRSVARFERDYIIVEVSGANKANIIVRLETEPLPNEIKLTAHCNPLVENVLGASLLKLRDSYLGYEKLSAS